ncbi:MAG: 5-formyltetrahydrofolate cyclo-ligase, partial [Lentisphaerae bacterium]|nr:5-formyltetrahydrofolate cyclo-ligase [Lentisphaerota bacterium]
MIAKSQLRKQIAAIRKSLSEETVSLNSRHIVERILKLEPFQKAETIALYMAFGGEVELSPLFS